MRDQGEGQAMIKLIVAVKRKAGMSAEDFHRHWRTTHAELVRKSPASKRYIRKYVQAHTLPGEYASGEVAFDGTAELWFDSVEDKDRFYSDPDYLAQVRPDESNFADMARTVFFVTAEETVL
jgi:uncharacterized protein (TIGR02118 family)